MIEIQDSVTHVASGDLWAGAEALVCSLAREQNRRRPGGVRCVLMNPGRLAEELQSSGIPCLILDERRQSLGKLARATRSYLSTTGPTVVHTHREKENLLGWLGGLGNKCSRRLVTTVHGLPEPIIARSSLRRTAVEHSNAILLRLAYDAIVGVSQDLANSLRQRFPHRKVYCIRNGVYVGASGATHLPSDRDGPLRILALGRLVPIKCFDRLGTLSDLLATKSVGRPIITLGGEGPLYGDLERQFDARISAGNVVMPGNILDPRGALVDTDALVITSDHEGIPMVALEALALGVPVFSFAVGGIPEIADAGVPLHLIPPKDICAMATSIDEYFSTNVRGQRIMPPASWEFDIRRCAEEYDTLYASLLHKDR